MSQNEDLNFSSEETEVINAVNLLIEKGYLVNFSGATIGITNKLTRLHQRAMSVINQVKSTTTIKPIEKIDLKKFKELAEIPWRITVNKGTAKEMTYNTGQISLAAEKYFNSKVVGKVNMDHLLAVTKAYYADERSARPTLTNYFINGLWEDVYKHFHPKEKIEVANQSFTGERRL